MARTKDFAAVIRAKMAANPDLAAAVEVESFNADIAVKVCQARKDASLTQKELASRIGTQQSVISRIEDADYDRHSLTTLRKIASALGKRLRVEFEECQENPEIKFIEAPASPSGTNQHINLEERHILPIRPRLVANASTSVRELTTVVAF